MLVDAGSLTDLVADVFFIFPTLVNDANHLHVYSVNPRVIIYYLIPPTQPKSTLFPYTTLFRSDVGAEWASHEGAFHPEHEPATDRKSTRLNSSHLVISYAVFCLKKKMKQSITDTANTLVI